ncbi:phosphoribosylformylglycinamidine synthase II, partial [Paenibacillus sepulcri]|nr:phosphoribosylformylglycinamidine synthase II [Paenibacillus sepulcri]
CRILDTPVIGGNVSLYNENAKGAIYPTPVIGMVGLVHDIDHITTQGFKHAGDVVVLLGETKNELGGSELQYVLHGKAEGRPPQIDLGVEKKLQGAVLGAIQQGLVASAHDLAEGGLAVALAESCISGKLGAEVNITTDLRADAALFSETQSRILLSASAEQAAKLTDYLTEQGVPNAIIGVVRDSGLTLNINGKPGVNAPVEQLEKVWKDAIPCLMK